MMDRINEILEDIDNVLSEFSMAKEAKSLGTALKTKNKEIKKFWDKAYKKWMSKHGEMTRGYKAEIKAARDTLTQMAAKNMFTYNKGDENLSGYQMGVIELVGKVGLQSGMKESIKEINEGKEIKIYKTISKEEWAKTPKDYKTVIKGQKYKMFFDPKVGTVLAPVEVK